MPPHPALRRGRLCKANGVDPQVYIADVIAKVAGDWPASRWDDIMPWNWMPPTDHPIAPGAETQKAARGRHNTNATQPAKAICGYGCGGWI
ncbi:transposase domain-containing protein [Sphingomonas parapaucimobilis]|uniref:transposase domain-containing protein n=1 Tax=Sphingomonas parapaucimobilis TaxID=28213 RepID=UPI0035C82E6B